MCLRDEMIGMMNRLLLCFFAIALVSCKKDQGNGKTFLKGFFPNAKDSLVVLYHNGKPIDTAFFDENKKILFKLDIKQEKLYHFEVDRNYQYVYLEPQDSIVISANLLNFRQSIAFSGKGAPINNFISQQMEDTEADFFSFKKYNSLFPRQYKKKIDSIHSARMKEYDSFLKDNPDISERAKNLALVTSSFPIYKEMESYPFVYQRNNKNSVMDSIPLSFYDYRKNIDFNDLFLEYYRPYYSYMVMFINNLAFKKYLSNINHEDINKEEKFHLKKISIIDSVFPAGSLRDNLFRNAAYSYVFNIQNNKECECYIEEFDKYNKNNIHRVELDQVFKSTIALQEGSIPPDFDVIDTEGNHTSLSKIVKPELTIYFFWSVNQKNMSSLIFNRVMQLKALFPEVRFVGIDMGQDMAQWCEQVPFKIQGVEQFHATNFNDLSRKFLINNISKSLILGKDTRIISAFESIFSPNLEKILLKN